LQGKTGNTAGCDATAADGQEGVDDGSLLTSSYDQSCIKRGPVHPKEYSTNHRDKLRIVVTTALIGLVINCLAVLVEVSGSQAVVGSEGMNVHGSSSIDSAQQNETDRFVKTVKEALHSEKYPNF